MNINIKTTNIEMTDAIRDYVYKKMEGLDVLAGTTGDELIVHVEVGKTSNHHKSGEIFVAEMRTNLEGNSLYASSEQEDLYAAIDIVKDQFFGEVKKMRSKKRSFVREGGSKAKAFIKGIFKK